MEDAEISPKLELGGAYSDLRGHHVTVNQIVAWNLAYFRKVAGLTQEELGQRLGWSKVIVSAAERSWDSKRPRTFSADDLAAIALAFQIPITGLFLPPEDDGVQRRYLVDIVSGECANSADLFWLANSDPTGEDEPAMAAYRRRYVGATNAYQDPEKGEEFLQYLRDITTEERILARLSALRGQYDALRGVLVDLDKLQEALSDHLLEVRARSSKEESS